ncbi:hypothetical protein V8E51_002532 [Hyaloscypha variabilis]
MRYAQLCTPNRKGNGLARLEHRYTGLKRTRAVLQIGLGHLIFEVPIPKYSTSANLGVVVKACDIFKSNRHRKGHRKPSSSPEVRANTLARNLLSNVRSVLGLEIGNSPSTSARTSGIPLPQNRLLGPIPTRPLAVLIFVARRDLHPAASCSCNPAGHLLRGLRRVVWSSDLNVSAMQTTCNKKQHSESRAVVGRELMQLLCSPASRFCSAAGDVQQTCAEGL